MMNFVLDMSPIFGVIVVWFKHFLVGAKSRCRNFGRLDYVIC